MQDEEREAAADSIVSLEAVGTLVLDEADRMLDLGFAEDIATVARLIATRDGESHPFLSSVVHPRTWMFSATWPKAAEGLATQLLLPGATHIVIGTQKDAGGADVESSGQKLVTAATVQQRFERIQGAGSWGTLHEELMLSSPHAPALPLYLVRSRTCAFL
jgi:superfamily II DNA/RNA helicase